MMTENADSLCRRARKAFARGEHNEARDLYRQAIELKPDWADAHYGLAATCYLLKDLREAAVHFQHVIKLDPKRSGAYINLGAIMNRYERYGDAMRLLKKGVQLDPKRAEAYFNLGQSYRKTSQFEKALMCYREAAKLKADFVDARYNLARMCMELEHYADASEHYRAVLRLRPDLDVALRGLADAERLLASAAAETAVDAEAPPDTTQADTEFTTETTVEADEQQPVPEANDEDTIPLSPLGEETEHVADEGSLEPLPPCEELSPSEDAGPPEAADEQADAGEQTPGDTAEEAEASEHAPGDTAADEEMPATVEELSIDPERTLEPEKHGAQLEAIYQLARETEEDGQRLLDVFDDEVGRALKDLGGCLTPTREFGADELADNTANFEEVLEKLRALHQELQGKFQKMQDLGDEILQQ